ncbi:DEKNAAC103608 [Brettanomyces naardenensis]|uniref:DEKNAAC103608 n=1 Tax=Brettanomyces naardenensis TaxID=13370 RepID=A0A448YNB9_BRENA|nr:DEKNAAC103608 [Brettanomyces naardenensis]
MNNSTDNDIELKGANDLETMLEESSANTSIEPKEERQLKDLDNDHGSIRQTHTNSLVKKLSHVLTGVSDEIKDLELAPDLENPGNAVDGYNPLMMNWDDDKDPGNPYNWSAARRWVITGTTAFLCFTIALGSSIYVSSVPEIMFKWEVSQTLCLGGVALFVLGLAWGPVIAAPLSELFGRKIVYLVSIPIAGAFTIGVAMSKNIGQVLVLRFFAALTSSGAFAICGGTIGDIWAPKDSGLAMALFCLAPMMGPVIGPIIGGFVAERKVSSDPNVIGGLRWISWTQLFFFAAATIPVMLMPETYKPVLMAGRMRKRGIKIKRLPLSQFLRNVVFTTLLRPMEMLVVEPIVLVLSIYTSFIFAVLFGFFEAYPIIFRGIYHMQLGVSGLPFLGCGVGLLIGSMVYILVFGFIFFKKWPDGYVGMKDKDGNHIPLTPEHTLLCCKFGSMTLAPALFWLAWSSRPDVHYMVPVASGVLFGFSLIQIFLSVLTYFALSYPPASVASAVAANNVLRYVVSCGFPLFTVQMLTRLHVDWGVSVFAFFALLLAPVPWIFTKYGERIRRVSKYGYAATDSSFAKISR